MLLASLWGLTYLRDSPARPLRWDDAGEEETHRRQRVHRRAPDAARGREERRRLVAGSRGARAPPVEPGQGVLARGGLHEGRPARLLPQRRPADPATPVRPPAHDEADARRHRRPALLREDRALAHAG